VIEAPTQALLQDVLRRESLSLLQYIRDAFPWTAVGEEEAWGQLRQLVDEDAAAITSLGHFLSRHKVPLPYVGQFPVDFTSINFVALDWVVPRLAEAQRREVATLEAEVPRAADPAARAALQELLEVKKRHLKLLEGLAASHHEPAVRT
jgi:hypothetical protein